MLVWRAMLFVYFSLVRLYQREQGTFVSIACHSSTERRAQCRGSTDRCVESLGACVLPVQTAIV